MKTIQPADAGQNLMGEVHQARLHLAKAESRLVRAKAQVRLARQRRKAAKLAARLAKGKVRLAKKLAAGAKQSLAELEARLATPDPTSVKRSPRITPVKKATVVSRRKRPALPKTNPTSAPVKTAKPVVRRAKSQRVAGLVLKKTARLIPVPEAPVTPVAIIDPADSKTTGQIIREVEEIFTGEFPAAAPVATGVQKRIVKKDQTPPAPQSLSTNATINSQETI